MDVTLRDNWTRWTVAAFFKAAKEVEISQYPVYFEGDEKTTRLERNFVEVRLDGPDFEEVSKDYYRLDVVLNLLVNSKLDPNDVYAISRVVGQYQRAFANNIQVYKVGTGVADDGSWFGCYQIQSKIEQNKFGVVSKDSRVEQITLEASYRLSL